MEVGSVNVDMAKMAHELTVAIRLKGVYRFRVRVAIALHLLRLARWVSGLNMIVDTENVTAASE